MPLPIGKAFKHMSLLGPFLFKPPQMASDNRPSQKKRKQGMQEMVLWQQGLRAAGAVLEPLAGLADGTSHTASLDSALLCAVAWSHLS